MNEKKSFPRPVYALLAVAALALLFFLPGALLNAAYLFFLDVLKIPMEQFYPHAYWAEVLAGGVTLVCFALLYRLFFGGKRAAAPLPPLSPRTGLWSFLAGLGVSGLSYLWLLLAERIPALAGELSRMEAGNQEMGGALGAFLLAGLLAPLLEELVFRGILLRALEACKPGWFAILVSAAAFGVFHMNVVQGVYAALMGVVAGILYVRYRRLLYPILLHMANNLLAVLQGVLPGAQSALLLDLLSLLMLLPLGYVLFRALRKPQPAAESLPAEQLPSP